jgi:hypothetical protein
MENIWKTLVDFCAQLRILPRWEKYGKMLNGFQQVSKKSFDKAPTQLSQF